MGPLIGAGWVQYSSVVTLYNIPEAGQYLGRTVWAVREMIYAGKIPYIRDGRRMLLDIKDMDSWIESSRCQYNY